MRLSHRWGHPVRPPKGSWFRRPLLSLVVANTIPLWGVLFLGWSVFSVVFLYWAENLAVGFFNVLKMACAKGTGRPDRQPKWLLIPFFLVHYGGFVAGHGLFVILLFAKSKAGFFEMLASVQYGLIALFASHAVSFVDDYLLNGEYLSAKLDKLMFSPYPRLIVLHVSIIAGGLFIQTRRSPSGALAMLVMLVVLKIILDSALYLASRAARDVERGQEARKIAGKRKRAGKVVAPVESTEN